MAGTKPHSRRQQGRRPGSRERTQLGRFGHAHRGMCVRWAESPQRQRRNFGIGLGLKSDSDWSAQTTIATTASRTAVVAIPVAQVRVPSAPHTSMVSCSG